MNDHTEKYGRRSNDTEVFGRKNDVATGKDILDVLEASYGAFAERITTVMTSTIVGNEKLMAAFNESVPSEAGIEAARANVSAKYADGSRYDSAADFGMSIEEYCTGRNDNYTRFDTGESFDNLDDYVESRYHTQIKVPQKTYKRILSAAESANDGILKNGKELPKFNTIVDGKTMYVYMNFDEQNFDLNEVFVDKVRIGSAGYNALYNFVKESISDGIGSSDDSSGNKLESWMVLNQALRRIGGTISEADRVHSTKSKSVGGRVLSKSAGASQHNSDDVGRTKDSGRRGRRLSTDSGAFSFEPNTRYSTGLSFDDVTPIEDSPYADPMYYKSARVIEPMNQSKFDAASLIKMLQGKGVKPDEIKWKIPFIAHL